MEVPQIRCIWDEMSKKKESRDFAACSLPFLSQSHGPCGVLAVLVGRSEGEIYSLLLILLETCSDFPVCISLSRDTLSAVEVLPMPASLTTVLGQMSVKNAEGYDS